MDLKRNRDRGPRKTSGIHIYGTLITLTFSGVLLLYVGLKFSAILAPEQKMLILGEYQIEKAELLLGVFLLLMLIMPVGVSLLFQHFSSPAYLGSRKGKISIFFATIALFALTYSTAVTLLSGGSLLPDVIEYLLEEMLFLLLAGTGISGLLALVQLKWLQEYFST